MLERNYRLWCSQNDIPVDDSPVGDEEMADEDAAMDAEPMEEDDEFAGFSEPDEADEELPDFFKQAQAEHAAGKVKGAGRKRKGRVHELVREKVRKVLEDETQLADKRAQKCEEGDFLKLLYAFNQQGIHFS
jgi:18S rRNA (adenine1779-N6/adenine1780-N6)-dimethyltransferase